MVAGDGVGLAIYELAEGIHLAREVVVYFFSRSLYQVLKVGTDGFCSALG
jgi:hypothetical protein